MEDDLDAIARNELAKAEWLTRFYFGNGDPGLKRLVHDNLDLIDAAEINSIPLGLDANGEPVVVKPGRYGPYVKRGEDTASVPENLPPDELTLDRALELLAAPKSDDPIGTDDVTGLPIYARNGRFGPYVQLGDADTLPAGEKPKMASLFKTMTLERLTLDEARDLLSLPRVSAPTRPTVRVSRRATAGTARSCARARSTGRSTPRSTSSPSRSPRHSPC